MEHQFTVPCLFGLEGIVADELRYMGIGEVAPQDGKVLFKGSLQDIAKVNMAIRCGERVLLNLATFRATTFDELFEKTKAINWEDYINPKDAFPVKGYSLKSELFSIPDIQKIIKKAAVEKLKQKYDITWFEESAQKKQISFSIFKDTVTIMLDTTGEGLHKRGYRAISNEAPLRETLAAAMVKLTRFRDGMTLVDPFCGSGTIPIEAAMIAANIAPGLKRNFLSEDWHFLPKDSFTKTRQELQDAIKTPKIEILGADINPDCTSLTLQNAKKAGVFQYIKTKTADIHDLDFPAAQNGIIICNPPYGERLMEQKEAERLYTDMGQIFVKLDNYKYFILTSHEDFENSFRIKADKNRKLYNGMIKCMYFQYFKKINKE